MVKQSGVAYTILRPVFFMQNLAAMVRDGVIHTAAGDGRVAMVDAQDVAAVAVDALTSHGCEGKTYTLTGPQAVSFDEVAETIARQTGNPVQHVRVAPDDVRTALQRNGVAAWFAQDMANLHSMLAAGYEDVVTHDVRTVRGLLGRSVDQDFVLDRRTRDWLCPEVQARVTLLRLVEVVSNHMRRRFR